MKCYNEINDSKMFGTRLCDIVMERKQLLCNLIAVNSGNYQKLSLSLYLSHT